jgi:aspartate-semialdehyde dehydrogenase
MKKGFRVALVGATGAVGRELLSLFSQREFPVSELIPLASARSVGRAIEWNGKTWTCRALEPGCFEGVDFAFFDASDAVSRDWVPEAAKAGAWVIDNSATFRMDPEVPLLVPEINSAELDRRTAPGGIRSWKDRVLAGPNCSTVQLVVALKPILERWGLKRVVVSTYQSVSGAGTAAMEELRSQTNAVLHGHPITPSILQHQIAFNCIPHIGGFKSDGYTSEEKKVIEESRKILGLPSLKITCTAVRVPTFSCHAESVNIETQKPFDMAAVLEALSAQEGLELKDDPSRNLYPLNVVHAEPTNAEGVPEGATGRDPVYVGRVRRDESLENGLNLWVVSDNLRKGAALNAIQIGEQLVRNLNNI